MAALDVDTTLEGRNGRYRITLSPDWEVWGPNGGYVAAIALRAAGAEARVRRPAAFAAHYLSVARFAPVDVEVTAVHRGRRSESFRVSLRQDGRPVLEAIVRTAAELPGLVHDRARAPDVPGPEGLRSAEEIYQREPTYPFWRNLESRPIDPDAWKDGRPAREPVLREWYRFRPIARFDDPFVDAARALLLIDTLVWPASCQHHVEPAFMAPSLDVVAWFHRSAHDAEWLLCDAHTPIAEGGLVGGSVRVWSADRRLIASGGAQLLCVPAPQT
jgi:acyl-CoA thioesterase-2